MLVVCLFEVFSVCSRGEIESNYFDYLFKFFCDVLVGLGGA